MLQELLTSERRCSFCDAGDHADADGEEEGREEEVQSNPDECEDNADSNLAASAKLKNGSKCRTRLGRPVGLIGGISCKDFASCNTAKKPKKGQVIYKDGSSPGKSADCMVAVAKIAASEHAPDWMLFENSDKLATNPEHDKSLRLFRQDLARCGYWTDVFTANATGYYLPQSRDRCFIICIRDPEKAARVRLREGLDMKTAFRRIADNVMKCQMCPPDLVEVLFRKNDARLKQELMRRKAWPAKEDITPGELGALRKKWVSLGSWVPAPEDFSKTKAADLSSPWWGTLTRRKKGCLQYHQASRSQTITAAKRKKDAALADMDVFRVRSPAGPQRSQLMRLQLAEDCVALLQLH